MKHGMLEDLVLVCWANPFLSSLGIPKNVDWKTIDLNYLLRIAGDNKVLFSLIQNLTQNDVEIPSSVMERIRAVKSNEERKRKDWEETLQSILDVLRKTGIDVLLIKSLRGYPHSSVDLDFLFNKRDSMLEATRKLRKLGYKAYTADDSNKVYCKKESEASVEVDLYHKISWRNIHLTLFDYERIWARMRFANSSNVLIPAPSLEDDVLISCAHSIFGHHYCFLGDLFYLKTAIEEKTDFQYMFETSERYAWTDALYTTLRYSDTLFRFLYNDSIIPEEVFSTFGKKTNVRLIDSSIFNKINTQSVLRFPMRYPKICELQSFLSKFGSSLKRDSTTSRREIIRLSIDETRLAMEDIYIFLETI